MGDATGNLAQPVAVVPKGHGLGCLFTDTVLGTDVIGRSQRELGAIPERGVIAGVVVGVAHEDVECNAGEQLPKGGIRIGKPRPDVEGKIRIGGVAASHAVGIVQFQNGECRYHHLPTPATGAVESVDQQNVSAQDGVESSVCDVETRPAG